MLYLDNLNYETLPGRRGLIIFHPAFSTQGISNTRKSKPLHNRIVWLNNGKIYNVQDFLFCI